MVETVGIERDENIDTARRMQSGPPGCITVCALQVACLTFVRVTRVPR